MGWKRWLAASACLLISGRALAIYKAALELIGQSLSTPRDVLPRSVGAHGASESMGQERRIADSGAAHSLQNYTTRSQTVYIPILKVALTMLYSVKQLTTGFRCITVWHRSAFTWPFAPGEQKKLQRLTLNSLLPIPVSDADLLMSIMLVGFLGVTTWLHAVPPALGCTSS